MNGLSVRLRVIFPGPFSFMEQKSAKGIWTGRPIRCIMFTAIFKNIPIVAPRIVS